MSRIKNYLDGLKTKNIHIVGAFGAEGSAVLEFLATRGAENITAHDFSADKEELWQNFSKTHLWIKKKTERLEVYEKLLKLPTKLNLKNEYLEGIMDADLIFAPSSWRLYKPNFPVLEKAFKENIEFSSITKLYFELANGKIISVTGTKGKGTTSRLIYEILRHPEAQSAEGSRVSGIGVVYLAGNDRRAGQELNKISEMNKHDILILETSNRQLMNDLGRSPDIGVITNISPDHIDEHGSFENYIEAKKSLFRYAGKSLPAGRQGNIAILNYDNKITRNFGNELSSRGVDTYFFSRKETIEKGIFLEKDKIYVNIKGKEYVCDVSDIKLIGEHNLENVLAAIITAYLAGAKQDKIREAIINFKGLRQRIEFIGEYDGVKFYDDSASTNPESTIAAINTLFPYKLQATSYKLVLVAGGDDKGMDYDELAKKIINKVDLLILLPGSGSEKLKCQITNDECQINFKAQMSNTKHSYCHPDSPVGEERSLANASEEQNIMKNKFKVIECNDFLEAMDLIKKQIKAGDIVLISPASAHFQARYIDVLKKPLRNIIVEKFR